MNGRKINSPENAGSPKPGYFITLVLVVLGPTLLSLIGDCALRL
jgi:hypothetical protein